MDRRFAQAFAVFLIAVTVYLQFFAWPKRAPPPPVTPATMPTTPAPDATTPTTPSPSTARTEPPRAVPNDVPRDDQIVVDTDLYRARFTNHGAALLELSLRKFFRAAGVAAVPEKAADPANWLPLIVDLDPGGSAFLLRRNPAGDPGPALPLEELNWTHELTASGGAQTLAFRTSDGDGRRFEKLVCFRDGRYDVDVELRFASDREGPAQGTDSYLLVGGANVFDERVTTPLAKPPQVAITLENESQLALFDAKSLDEPRSSPLVREGLAPFFGVCNNYFAFALKPDAAVQVAGLVENVTATRVFDRLAFERAIADKERSGASVTAEERTKIHDEHVTNVRAEAALKVPFPSKAAPSLSMKFTLFAGARSPDALSRDELEPFRLLYEVQYGNKAWLRWINRVLLVWMRWMHVLTRNWGVAIILLTITVKVLLFPLNRLQSRTMEQFQKKMKRLQPELDELKKKFKNNMQRMNQEQQKLMRAHGVRPPVFGCLIVFLQMPVWFGLFQIMTNSPELRQQPFFGWITDLSAPDAIPLPFHAFGLQTFHLLPILMVVAWLVQNRMMPKPSDPQQAQMQKMMNFFPILFGIFLYNYASGQSLYMLTNSLLGMLQMKLLRVTPTN